MQTNGRTRSRAPRKLETVSVAVPRELKRRIVALAVVEGTTEAALVRDFSIRDLDELTASMFEPHHAV